MPIHRKGDKYSIGSGPAMYKSKASAVRAYRAYLAKEGKKEDRSESRKKAKRG